MALHSHREDLDQVLLRSDLLAVGEDDRSIKRRLRSGDLHRVRHGAYFDRATWDRLSPQDRHRVKLRAVLLSARCHSTVSHISAAVEHGVPTWDLSLSDVHVTRLDARSGRAEAGVIQHRGLLDTDDIDRVDGVAITSGTRTALDVIRISPDVAHALVVVNGLLHAGLTSVTRLREAHARAVDWPGSRKAHVVLRHATPLAESPGETLTHDLLRRHGFPPGLPQFEVYDEQGRFLGRVDLAWPEHGVFVEFDGRQKYSALLGPGQSTIDVILREKRREERICRVKGWVCIRLTWADLDRPHEFLTALRRALMAHPPRR